VARCFSGRLGHSAVSLSTPSSRWRACLGADQRREPGRAGTDPHRKGETWTCRVLPLVVLIRMPVVDSRPSLPPGSAPMSQGGLPACAESSRSA
jgi:hypothetical protein